MSNRIAKGQVKKPGPKDLALVCPLEGALHDSAQPIYGVLEYWKNKTQLRSSVTLTGVIGIL